MTRFFYTDPLEAAYMAKHFGMQLEGLEYRAPTESESGSRWSCINDFYDDRHFFIAQESLHLLEVQVSDMVLDSDGINGIAVMLELQLEQCRGAVIIERQGRPFFWPQPA